MSEFKYKIEELELGSLNQSSKIKKEDKDLVSTYEINNLFEPGQANVEFSIYGVDNTLLEFEPYFKDFSQLLNAQSAGKLGASVLTIDPVRDIVKYGYDTGDVRVLYTFTNNLFAESQKGGEFFIESLSPDKTEIRALSTTLSDDQLQEYVDIVKSKLNSSAYFSELRVNFGENQTSIGLNLDTESTDSGLALTLKLYQPVEFDLKTTFTVEEFISDSLLYEITTEVVEETLKVPFLKGPNFYIDEVLDNNQPTEFLNYNELFSYPVSNSYFELYSLFNDKSAQIAIDHTEFSNFIHYSSAEERLRNFQYKLQLIESYQESIDNLTSASLSTSGSSNPYLTSTTGSKDHYEKLITGIVNNFDHYDRYLYFESSSFSWPKSTTKKPHQNYPTTSSVAINWFNSQVQLASNYDNSNFDILTNTIPTFIRENSNNEPYLMFTHMIGHHFDNLWVYFKAVSDKYDTDHRLNFGVSKDMVRDAIESFGVKMYNSNQNIDNLFSMFVGEGIQTGSEQITSMSIATSASFNSGSTELEYLQPVAKNNYEKEIYKRIYHNLPLLTKTKGTERGLRALINCFGIPREILTIKTFGGAEIDSPRFFGPEFFATSSMYNTASLTSGSVPDNVELYHSASHKIRLDNTGSIVSGSTLSRYTSIVKKDKKYTDDHHQIEVGFNLSRGTDEFIDVKISGSFDIDQYIGDPRDRYQEGYPELTRIGKNVVNDGWSWENMSVNWNKADFHWDDALAYSKTPRAFIRLLNFFDSSLFRIIKDFAPARSKLDTGVIIKSHKLARSKAKEVQVSWEDVTKSGSIGIGKVTGSQGGSYDTSGSFNYTTNYSASFISPLGKVQRNVTDESPMYNGEFSGSLLISTDGEVTKLNPFKKIVQPELIFDITSFNLSVPLPPGCAIFLTGSYIGEYFKVLTSGSGTVSLTYPTTISPISSSFSYVTDFDTYEFLTIQASTGYGNRFRGWYSDTTGTLLTTNNPATIYYIDESTRGDYYYAYFEEVLYRVNAVGDSDGTVSVSYPTTIAATRSAAFEHDFATYAFFTVTAEDYYPAATFNGWWNAETGGTKITSAKTLSVYESTVNTHGKNFYARFN